MYTAGDVGAFRVLTRRAAMAGVFEGGLVEAAGFQPYSGEPAGVAETETGDKEQVAGPAPVDRTQLVVSDW